MAYYFKKNNIIALIFLLSSGISFTISVRKKKNYASFFSLPHIEHIESLDRSWWFVTSDDTVRMYNEQKREWEDTKEKNAFIVADQHGLMINKKRVAGAHLIIRSPKSLVVNGFPYTGIISFAVTSDHNAHMVAQYPMVINKAKVVGSALRDDYMCYIEQQNSAREKLHKTEQLGQLQEARKNEHGDLPEKKELIIRVLLHQADEHQVDWHFDADAGFLLNVDDDLKKSKKLKSVKLHIAMRNGRFIINKRALQANTLTITPLKGFASCKGIVYQGSFIIKKDAGKFLLMNALDLEDYVFSVLKTESWPGWPLEMNKVCAIASRTYAIAIAMRSQKAKKPYHIKNTNEHQTYSGMHGCAVIKKAVEETQGIFIGHQNEPIVAMYDICCGGVIPAYIEDFNFAGAPYLARQYPCKHCKRCRVYSWGTRCRLDEFSRRVSQRYKNIKQIKKVKMVKKDKAGLVQLVELQSATGTILLSGRELYSLMKEVKSFYFRVHQKGSTIVFDQARGYGHHIGLCQWGAREMVRDGWDHKKILQFYYPNTTFMKLS